MIWLYLLLWALIVLVGMWRLGAFSKATLQLLGAALLIAVAGYAWQGRPGLAGAPAAETAREDRPETAFAALRGSFLPQFDSSARWLIIADSYQNRGRTADAAGIIRSGLRADPDDLALWTGLGNALVLHGGGVMTPAAELAYRRASAIAPGHPAPLFFYGMNLIEGGQVDAGEAVWRDLLAAAPANASWRPLIAQRLAMVDQMRAMGRLPPRATG